MPGYLWDVGGGGGHIRKGAFFWSVERGPEGEGGEKGRGELTGDVESRVAGHTRSFDGEERRFTILWDQFVRGWNGPVFTQFCGVVLLGFLHG